MAAPATYYFQPIADSAHSIPGGQLQMTVTSGGTGLFAGERHNVVVFGFQNFLGSHSSLTGIYFQGGGPLLSWGGMTDSDGSGGDVAFVHPGNPADMAGGHLPGPDFAVNSSEGRGLEWSAGSRGRGAGLNGASEWVNVFFYLQRGKTVDDVLEALENGAWDPSSVWNEDGTLKINGLDGIRVGLRMQSLADDGLGGYLNRGRVNSVDVQNPEPATITIWLCLVGLTLLVGRKVCAKHERQHWR